MANRQCGCGNRVTDVVLILLFFFFIWAIARPPQGIPDKAKEAVVKQNLHAIQLALERYAVDHNGHYPPFMMGGDWTDSYVAWESWKNQNIPGGEGLERYPSRSLWLAAPEAMGDALILESYMPTYPRNPFAIQSKNSKRRILAHLGMTADGTPLLERYVGGRDGGSMYEVFGPTRMQPGQSIQGDYFVHHIFNSPPYDERTDVRKEIGVDWNSPSGNELLVGNFSYYPWPEGNALPWYSTDEDGNITVKPVTGYTLAGYGGIRTPGQDVYNRNGNYKGRYRTESCDTDCDPELELFNDDIPCICDPSSETAVTFEMNNGGSDTLRDGVVITLDSGVDKRSGRVNFDVTEGE